VDIERLILQWHSLCDIIELKYALCWNLLAVQFNTTGKKFNNTLLVTTLISIQLVF